MSLRTPGGSGASWNSINPTNNIMGIFNGVFIKPKRLSDAPLERYSGFDIRDSGLLFRDSRFVDSLIR